MVDIVIVNVPSVETFSPLMAPALLKSCVTTAGFTSAVKDFNIRYNNALIENKDEITNYFCTNQGSLEIQLAAKSIIDKWADEIVDLSPIWVGISVFTYQCRIATELISKSIKEKNSTIKIVIGGAGISEGGINGKNEYPRRLKDRGIIDYFIMSEAEISIVKLLQGNDTYSGINEDTYTQIKDIDNLPYPDYTDYNIKEYRNFKIPIYGSRGCVRKCAFCDIHQHWKYNFRSGKSIAAEMIYQSKKYHTNKFIFADSLVNGSLKEFKEFIKIMAEYNSTTDDKIQWHGYYIARDFRAESDEYWKLLKNSGAVELSIGIESGSEKVRIEMDKKINDIDIEVLMRRLVEHQIKCNLLLIIGYPTETIDDFEATLNFIKKYQHLSTSIVNLLSISDTLSILPGTPLYQSINKLNIILDPNHENNWICKDNPTLTLSERIRRVAVAKKLATDLGYTLNPGHDLLEFLNQNVSVFDTRLTVLKKVIEIKKYDYTKT